MDVLKGRKELHNQWKADVALLYDTLITSNLEAECLSIQWVPDLATGPEDVTTQRLLLGFNFEDQSCIILARVTFPNFEYRHPSSLAVDEPQLQRLAVLAHPGEVSCIRLQPNGNLLCSQSSDAQLYIYDLSATSTAVDDQDDQQQQQQHTCTLVGQQKPGLAAEWHPTQPSVVAACSSDAAVRVWDVQRQPSSGTAIEPATTLTHHARDVGDIAWTSPTTLACVSDDNTLTLHDVRQPPPPTPSHSAARLPSTPNSVAALFDAPSASATASHVAVGLDNGRIQIFDPRHVSAPVCSAKAHHGRVLQLLACPHSPHVLYSTGDDISVKLWDWKQMLAASGAPSTSSRPAAAAAAKPPLPPGLLFVHIGHQAEVVEMACNPSVPGMLASVAGGVGDNLAPVLQMWRPHCLRPVPPSALAAPPLAPGVSPG